MTWLFPSRQKRTLQSRVGNCRLGNCRRAPPPHSKRLFINRSCSFILPCTPFSARGAVLGAGEAATLLDEFRAPKPPVKHEYNPFRYLSNGLKVLGNSSFLCLARPDIWGLKRVKPFYADHAGQGKEQAAYIFEMTTLKALITFVLKRLGNSEIPHCLFFFFLFTSLSSADCSRLFMPLTHCYNVALQNSDPGTRCRYGGSSSFVPRPPSVTQTLQGWRWPRIRPKIEDFATVLLRRKALLMLGNIGEKLEGDEREMEREKWGKRSKWRKQERFSITLTGRKSDLGEVYEYNVICNFLRASYNQITYKTI